MRKTLIFVMLLMLFIPAVIAIELPNASFTVNRTGNLGNIPQPILITNTSTVPESITAWNMSLQGTANDTVWYNVTTVPATYTYEYKLKGNFTPYLIVHYADGMNTSQPQYLNTTWLPPNASFTTNRTNGYIGQVSQVVLFTDTSTFKNSILYYNLSLNGTAVNDSAWYNVTSFPTSGYAYTYSIPGNYTPYLNITYFGGDQNRSYAEHMLNVTYLVHSKFTCSRPTGSLNLNGTRPFTLVCNDTSQNLVPISSRNWYGTCLSSNLSTQNISMTCTYGGYKTIELTIANDNGTNVSASPTIWVMKPHFYQDFVPTTPGDFWDWLVDFLHGLFGGSG